MNYETFSTFPIDLNMAMHSSVAPPCCEPQRDPIPAEIHANGLASDDPAILTAVVDGP